MRIESAPQSRQEYRKSTDRAAPAASFGQAMRTAQDRYVPGARPQPVQTGAEFSRVKPADGRVTVSNATQAKLKQLAELDKQSDYTGMSYDEIYAEIWNRYNEAFDGNMMAIKPYFAGPAEWAVINNQFVDEITTHIDHPAMAAAHKAADEAEGKTNVDRTNAESYALNKLCRDKAGEVCQNARWKALGYDGMSFEEREAAIKEKYAGKNTTLDFLKMQGELYNAGVLHNTMGEKGTSTYLDLIGYQFDVAYNPNSIYVVGPEKCDFFLPDQWYRVADQPFDMAKFAANTKDLLSRISFSPDYPVDYAAMIEKAIDRFMNCTVDDSLDHLLNMTEKA